MNTLRAVFLVDDKLRMYRGARCDLPTGEVVEVQGRKTPLYDLARELDAQGYGDCWLQAFTPEGKPSLRGLVKVMAGLAVEESDRGGLKLRKYQPFPRGRSAADGDCASEGSQAPGRAEKGLYGSTAHEEAA